MRPNVTPPLVDSDEEDSDMEVGDMVEFFGGGKDFLFFLILI